jgi:TRAP-type C4-dicarboxylate transport system permease small subunit
MDHAPTHPPGALDRVLDRAVGGLCRAVLWASTAVIFVILCGNTVLRYATGSSLQWGNEVPELLFPWLVMAGVVLAAQQGAHIATTFLMEWLPVPLRRGLVPLTWLAVAALHLTLAIATFRLLEIVHDERSPILRVPGSVTYGCVMAGLLLLALLGLQSAWRTWRRPVPATAADADGAPAALPTAHW